MNTKRIVWLISLDVGGGNTKAIIHYDDDTTEWVQDPRGNKSIRTAVYCGSDGQVLIGEDAIDRGYVDPDRLATDFKRDLGNPDHNYWGGTASAEDVAAAFLTEIRKLAEKQCGQKIPVVSCTSPANFPDWAKHALRGAFATAGLPIIADGPDGSGMLAEPTAAVLAYAVQHALGHEKVKIAVWDPGSTTFDFSVIEFDNGQGQVLNTRGVMALGGQDLLRALMDLALEKGVDAGLPPAEKMDSIQRHDFEQACERAKIGLSSLEEVLIPIQIENERKTVKVKQVEYQERIDPHVKKMLECSDDALAEAKMTINDVNYFVLSGGPSRSPFIQQQVAAHYGITPKTDLDPSAAIATGAGQHGLWLLKRRQTGAQSLGIRIRECVSHNIALLVVKKINGERAIRATILIHKGLPVPTTVARAFYLEHPHLTCCDCQFVQCDAEDAPPEECFTLGGTLLTSLPLEDIRTDRVEVTATFDAASLVTIKIKDKVTGKITPVKLDKEEALRPAAA